MQTDIITENLSGSDLDDHKLLVVQVSFEKCMMNNFHVYIT